jgi:chaperone required for assembly of F1-ATPase
MVSTRLLMRSFIGVVLLLASCATAPKAPGSSPRIADSAPEKVAAQRAAAPSSLELEPSDERWGIEAARERKRQQDAARARQQPPTGGKSVDVLPPPTR